MTIVAAWLFLLCAPLSLGAAAFLWHLYRADSRGPDRTALALAFAVIGSVAAGVALYLGVISLAYLAGLPEVVTALAPGVLPAFIALDLVPIALAAYLRWLQAQG